MLNLRFLRDFKLKVAAFLFLFLGNDFKGVRGGPRTAATSKMNHFVIIVNGWKLLIIITKCSILDVAAVLDPPLGVSAKT